ncbi:Aste57867_8329 [Aphanomyces stellatus]|uniref:Aste57867_8329 protein n=1 Tax=Aphanomyces stellatus TaxID=120398 RepID=A0A485KK47_9STRA|nr:hypothetical protein As57867_008297 [Aphanomyces stellatus]VFT85216.1 Aste57867_8329 [Aphanomyces stellatus]
MGVPMTPLLTDRLWASASKERYACLYHAFVLGIGTGELPMDAFQTFLLQDAFFLHGFLQAFAHAVTKASSPSDTMILVSLMQGVNDELKLHASYMQSWGIDAYVVEDTTPTAATRAYVDFLLHTAKSSSSVSEILAAMVPCARLYAFLGQHLHAAAPAPSSQRFAKWIETYASTEFEASAVAIEALLNVTAAREHMPDARLSALYLRAMQLELDFFDAYFPMDRMPEILRTMLLPLVHFTHVLHAAGPIKASANDGSASVALVVEDFDAVSNATSSSSVLAFVLHQIKSAPHDTTSSSLFEVVDDAERAAVVAACRASQRSTTEASMDVSTKMTVNVVPRVLCIAGSDSGGGAGIQADMKACMAQGVFSTSAITAITVQDTRGVHGIHGIPIETLQGQIDCVLDDIGADVIKTGMLATPDIIRCVVRATQARGIPLVVDPVMVSTSGHRLLEEEAHRCLVDDLFPLALIITPNLPEASVLLQGREIHTVDDMKQAALDLHHLGRSTYVLVKGGHLSASVVVDVLYDGHSWVLFESPRIDTPNTHGTGCTLAASIAANYAKIGDMVVAVRLAIRYVQSILRASQEAKIGHGHNGPMLHWL